MATRRLGEICKHDSHLPYTTDFLAPGESALEVITSEVQRIFLRYARYLIGPFLFWALGRRASWAGRHGFVESNANANECGVQERDLPLSFSPGSLPNAPAAIGPRLRSAPADLGG